MVSLYARINRLGIMDHPLSQKLFRKAYFRYKSLFEDPFLRLTRQKPELFRNGHILDAGANIGYTAAVFARAVSPGFQVHAFEPETRNFEQLLATIAERGIEQTVVPVQAAVGDESRDTELWINPLDQTDHRLVTRDFHGDPGQPSQTLGVRMVRLDDYVAQWPKPAPIAFIKLDIQGYEGPALEGMTRILADNPRAAVAVEYCRPKIESLGFDPDAILRFFQERRYTGYALKPRQSVQPVDLTRIDSAAGRRGYLDVLFLKE